MRSKLKSSSKSGISPEKEKALYKVYKKWKSIVHTSFYDKKEDLIAKDIMGYGTSADETFFSIKDLEKILKRDREQSEGIQRKVSSNTVYRKITADGNGAVFAEEFNLGMEIEEKEHNLFLRATSVFEFIEGKWKAVHFHASAVDENTKDDSWNINIWKRKTEELEKNVAEKTADLILKNLDLEIEASLERVRTIAMGMRKRGDLLDVSEVFFKELKNLGFGEIRNAMINIHDHENETYLNYDYSDTIGKTVSHIHYDTDPTIERQIKQIRKGKDAFSETSFKGKELTEYKRLRKIRGEKDDPRLEKISVLYYYFYSIGNGSIGISTFESLSKNKLEVLMRFRNVFEFAYRRFEDVSKAEAQTREAKIEASLERVRAIAMSMMKMDDLLKVCESVFSELKNLGFSVDDLRNSQIVINNDEKAKYYGYQYSDFIGGEFAEVSYDLHPTITLLRDKMRKSDDAFADIEISGAALKDWKSFVKSFPQKPDEKLFKATALHYYFYSVGIGALGISSYRTLAEDQLKILKRFRNVFNLCYQRYIDISHAEAHAMEAKIETSLERVRAIALGMRRSEELLNVCEILFNELKSLGFDELRNSMININNDEEKTFLNYDYSDTLGKSITPLFYNIHPLVEKQIKQVRKGKDAFSETSFKGKELEEWKRFRKSRGEKNDPRLNKISALYYFFYSIGSGSIGISTFGPISKEKLELLKRFRNVFEFAYRRYIDVTQAEAQTKEAKIEIALERVRSRTMAMQRSEEFSETTYILFQQFLELGEAPDQITIGIIDAKEKVIDFWTTMEGKKISSMVKFPVRETDLMKKIYKAWKSQKRSIAIEIKGKELHDYIDYRIRLTGVSGKNDHAHDRRYILAAFFSKGMITISTNDPRSNETKQLLERFAGVFDLTYTRFLDLKLAEAQTKEAMIELALERVRARSLAMHSSDEFVETSDVLFAQLKVLGIESIRTGVATFDEKNKTIEVWSRTYSGENSQNKIRGVVPVQSHIFFEKCFKAWKKKEPYYSYEVKGKEVKKYYKSMTSILSYPEIKDFNPREFFYTFFFPEGSLNVVRHDPLREEDTNMMKRFATVFGLIYRRFLDLQKAETQAHEAKMEASLERVRAVSMSMMKPDDLLKVSESVYKEFVHLGFTELRNAQINIYDDDKITYLNYAYSDFAGPELIEVPVSGNAKLVSFNEEIRKKSDSFAVLEFTGKELLKWKSYIYKHGKKVDERLENSSILIYNFYSIGSGALGISTFNKVEGAQLEILERFRNVFGLAYQRYTDIALAESQAREAKIEAALERVRSRSMGMQKSEELKEVIQVVYEQLVQLNIFVEHSGFIIDYKTRDDMHIWLADKNMVPFEVTIPYFDSPHWNSYLEAKKKGMDFFANQLSFEEKNKFYTDLFKLIPGVPEETLEYYLTCPGLAISTVLLDNVGLYIENFTGTPYSDDDNITLVRFGKVFQQTYTRFLDLQKAEDQAKEAKIETALERIRARALAMHSSDELLEVAKVMREQMTLVGQSEIETSAVHLYNEDPDYILSWRAYRLATVSKGDISFGHMAIPKGCCELVNEMISYFQGDQDEYTIEVKGEKLTEWHKILFKLAPDIKKTLGKIIPETRYYHFSKFSGGALLMVSSQKPSEESVSLQYRSAKVFDLAYRRFLDLKKAEAQAREAKIEMGLERVRSKTMAMQKSDDLSDAASLLFEQIKELGLQTGSCGYHIWDNESNENKTATVWVSSPDGGFQPPFNLPHTKSPIYKKVYDAKVKGVDFIETEALGKVLKDHFKYLLTLPVIQDVIQKYIDEGYPFPEKMYYNIVFFSKGYLSFHTNEPCPEFHDIFKRFGKVFQQTYTRFLDLQKAEAQAREARIEAALEKVRSRSLAMHKAEELSEVITVVVEKLKELEFSVADGVALITFNHGSKDLVEWMANPGFPAAINFYLPYFDHPVLANLWDAKKKGEEFIVKRYTSDENKSFLNHIFEYTDFKHTPEAVKEFCLAADTYATSIAFQKNTAIFINDYSGKSLSEQEVDILKRFAKVFEQTYTRFLDLQKAEAQAREAQIEAALEKVRSRSLAMHNSDELKKVVSIAFEKMKELGIGMDESASMSITTFSKNSKDIVHWIISPEHVSGVLEMHLPYFDNPTFNEFFAAKDSGKDLFVKLLNKKEKDKYYKQVFASPDWSRLPEELKQWVFAQESFGFSAALMKHSAIFLNNFSGKYFSDTENDLLKRFARVFEQAFIRFLDLQKAEAQAREAQIELGLERVRARAMAMQSSDELSELVDAVFKELTKLDFALNWCIINIIDEPTLSNTVWAANPEIDKAPESYHMKFEDYPFHDAMMKGWKEKNPKCVYVIEGQEKKEYDEYLFTETEFRKVPATAQAASRAMEKYVVTFSFSNFGGLQTVGDAPLSEANIDILSRFGKVFDLTYTRFNDLKQAEAQAREAKIEASLERVRSQSMGMQTSEDLSNVTTAMFEQIRMLGGELYATGIVFCDKHKNHVEQWHSVPGAGMLTPFIVPVDLDRIHQYRYDQWKKGAELFSIEIPEDFIAQHFETMFNLPTVKAVLDDFSKKNIPMPETPSWEIDYGASFKYGYILISALKPFKETDILPRFAKVFEQSYIRFLDLKQAEAQAREAQIEASLERVRSKAMAMQKSEDLNMPIATIYEELDKLNLETLRCGIGVIDKDKKSADVWTTTKTELGTIVQLSRGETIIHPLIKETFDAWLRQEDFSYLLEGEDLKNFYNKFTATNSELPDSQSVDPEREGLHQYYYVTSFPAGNLYAFRETEFPDEAKVVMKRFADVINFTYTRFNDLKLSEAQTREAQIETALERVRSCTLAMQKSDELAETAAVVFKQLINLGISPNRLYIGIINDDSGDLELWATDEDGSKVSTQFTGNVNKNASIKKMYAGWKEQKKSIIIDIQGEELDNYFKYLTEELNVPFRHGLSQKRRVQTIAFFSKGFIGIASPDEQPEETSILLERFAAVFNLTYTRFHDLRHAEEQTHKALIETAMERVRARALSMQQPEELADVAKVLRHEMGLLGVEELETCSIFINDETEEKSECWYALKDLRSDEKKLVSDHFKLDYNETKVGRQMLQFYHSDEKQTSIEMKGETRKEWISYCAEKSDALKGYYGEIIPDRTYHLYKFSHGGIGVASAGVISEESWSLLSRAASAFSLAYSRFKDLTQSRLDLKRLKEEKQRAEEALTELKSTQSQLIQSEKMASLGELTAGIAHEIQNPLNFVNNFSEVNAELIDELNEELGKGNFEDAVAIAKDIKENEEKIKHHGKRAEGIVKGMLQHSRTSSGVKEPTNINALADEYLRLAYHGLRAKDKTFNATMKTDFDETLDKINIIPQDIGRVILNLITNAFYVVDEKKKQNPEGYEPTVTVSTKKIGDKVEVSVKDNGNGIPQKVLEKIFQPFFTTKPTGQGTGLGLSLSYDIVKAHGGELKVETKEGEGSEFIILLPITEII
ncbi:MAG: ATP-binding protein [Ignavibacteria bacterium]